MTSQPTMPVIWEHPLAVHPPYRLTRAWKLIIASAAVAGTGTCVALGFLWAAVFIPQPGTVHVLDRAPSDQDMPAGDYASLAGDVRLEDSRFLGSYNNSNYFVTPVADDEDAFCLLTEPVIGDGLWEFACNTMIDGRYVLTSISDMEGRWAVLVPDQFDHAGLEADGWVSVHQNLLVQPKGPGQPDAARPVLRYEAGPAPVESLRDLLAAKES